MWTSALGMSLQEQRWRAVRAWIRLMVRLEPRAMREVSRATFGNLAHWLEKGSDNVGACGCLVGTVALKLVEARNSFRAEGALGGFVCTRRRGKRVPGEFCMPTEVVSSLMRGQWRNRMREQASTAGVAAAGLMQEWGQEEAVTRIKAEIVRQLGLRRKRLARG